MSQRTKNIFHVGVFMAQWYQKNEVLTNSLGQCIWSGPKLVETPSTSVRSTILAFIRYLRVGIKIFFRGIKFIFLAGIRPKILYQAVPSEAKLDSICGQALKLFLSLVHGFFPDFLENHSNCSNLTRLSVFFKSVIIFLFYFLEIRG